jgi:choline monooxygenase
MPNCHESDLPVFDADLPLERARTIPNTWYHEPSIYELEKQRVFADTWQLVGRAAQVAEPGSFLTAEIAGEPILIVRDEKSVLRAFFNVCRHRAAPLLNEPCGRATKLRCRYHGWTYDLAGKLKGTPEFDGVQEFPKEDNGLVEMAVATWGPLIWVHLDKPAQPLEEFLAPLPAWIQGRGLDKLKFSGAHEYVLNCNWKVYVDNYLDGGYHVNTVHPGLAGVLDYTQYKTMVHGNTSVQTSPLKANESDATTTKTRTGNLAAYWWVMPNFMLNLYEGVMDTNLVLPLEPGRCKVIFDFYFANTDGPEAQQYIKDSIAVANQVQDEDMGICEAVQRGLSSRSYRTGRFSVKREAAGYHFHRLLARRLQGERRGVSTTCQPPE